MTVRMYFDNVPEAAPDFDDGEVSFYHIVYGIPLPLQASDRDGYEVVGGSTYIFRGNQVVE